MGMNVYTCIEENFILYGFKMHINGSGGLWTKSLKFSLNNNNNNNI